jgi:glycosyltransferase involved in cell wall biosynthesis
LAGADSVRLAVVIPTYNRAGSIERAVRSVLAHPRDDIEIAVVDDCSTDNTMDVLARIGDRRLQVLRTDRHGYANRARNLGVARTTAPVLAFLDSDDEFEPGRVDRLIKFFDARAGVHATLDGFHVVHHGIRRSFAPPFCVLGGNVLARMLVAHALPLTNSVLAIRRLVFEEIGGFDDELQRHQDRDLLLRLARRHRLVVGTGIDAVKHQSPDSVSRDAAGYVAGFEALVSRHAVFTEPWARDILGYLVARGIVRELSNGRLGAAWRMAQTVRTARNLPVGVGSALLSYRAGRRLRRAAEAELAAMAPPPRDVAPLVAALEDRAIHPAKQV